MDQARTVSSILPHVISNKVNGMTGLLTAIPHDVIALIARVSVSAVFWQSGQTKLDGWHVSSNAVYLFQNEYKVPLIDPWVAAPAQYDPVHRDIRLSRCMADPWHLGHVLPCGDRSRTWVFFTRSPRGTQARPNLIHGTPVAPT